MTLRRKMTPKQYRKRWLTQFVARHGRLPGQLSREHLAIVRAGNPTLARLGQPERPSGALTPEHLSVLRDNDRRVQLARAGFYTPDEFEDWLASWMSLEAATELGEKPDDELAKLEREILDHLNGDGAAA